MTALDRLPLAALLVAALSAACSTLDPKECDKLRGEAFEMLNKAQSCNNDADCRQSVWPGCEKPVSNATFDKIKPLADKYKEGQCEEPKVDCREPPEAYCKQGLCVHHEKGIPGGAGNPPAAPAKAQ